MRQALGVRYVLEGSVRKARNRVRITGQLIDAQSGAHIWADRFDGELADIFELQDQVAGRVVVAIVPTLERAHLQRSSTKLTENLDAYDCCLRGWACIDQFTREANIKALGYFERAIELDPRFALAWAQAAGCYIQRISWRWSDGSEQERNETERLTRKALELDPDDPRVLTLSGFALGMVLGLNDEGLALIEKATDLDPNYSFAWLQRGFACLRVGKPAISHIERAIRLNPRDVRVPFAKGNGLAVAYMYEGDYGKAIELAEESLKQLPDFAPILMTLIVARAHAGQIAEARKTVEALLAIRPQATISSMAGANRFPAYRQILVEGFRLAGMPE
jgi:tetratricopeptide (TPR) repeat protein